MILKKIHLIYSYANLLQIAIKSGKISFCWEISFYRKISFCRVELELPKAIVLLTEASSWNLSHLFMYMYFETQTTYLPYKAGLMAS